MNVFEITCIAFHLSKFDDTGSWQERLHRSESFDPLRTSRKWKTRRRRPEWVGMLDLFPLLLERFERLRYAYSGQNASIPHKFLEMFLKRGSKVRARKSVRNIMRKMFEEF